MTWTIQRHDASPAVLHAREVRDPITRSVWIEEVTSRAIVLGSAQSDERVDVAACARAAVDVVRRRSGGGAVLVAPDAQIWVDLVIPADDPEWRDDVGQAFGWVGEAWAATLRTLGYPAEVHHGGLERTRWSADVCFAGLAPGEVTIGGRKVVGIAQRRTRGYARFQCAALRRWDPVALLSLLNLDDGTRDEGVHELSTVAMAIEDDPDVVLATLLRLLP